MSVTLSVTKPNTGSGFCITFPYILQDPTLSHEEVKLLVRQPEAQRMAIEGKVLVAEDNLVSQKLVKRMLKISGYDTILAEDGQQAVDKFKENSDIALVLMDVQMPNMDSLDATRLIRELEAETSRNRPVPIIALSAGAMKGDHKMGLAVGMTEYLTKPVNFWLLQETLRKYLGPRPGW